MPVGGFWAWTTYLFAGTGFAMAIVLAIIGGGVAMLIFKDEIVEWIVSNDYKCQNCGKVEWKAGSDDERTLEKISNDATHRRKELPASELLKEISADLERKNKLLTSIKPRGELKNKISNIDKRLESVNDYAIKKLIADLERKNNPPALRYVFIEKLLSKLKCEIRIDENAWLVVDSKGNSKKVNSIDELEQLSIIEAYKFDLTKSRAGDQVIKKHILNVERKDKPTDQAIKKLIADLERKNNPPALRYVYIEKLLSKLKCEIRIDENAWLVVDSKGNSKKVNSIDELELLSISYAQKVIFSV